MLSFHTVIISGVVSCIAALIAIFVLNARSNVERQPPDSPTKNRAEDEVVFLFHDRKLVDATSNARAQIPAEPSETDEWGRFVIAFSQRFEGLEQKLDVIKPGASFRIAEVPEDPDSLILEASEKDDHIRITLLDPLRETRSELVAHYSLAALRSELHTLRSVAERAPSPTWKQREDGTIVWANSAYMSLAREVSGETALMGWPPPDVFAASKPKVTDETVRSRVRISNESGGNTHWFDLVTMPGEIETLYFAIPIDQLVQAESTLSDFVQNLTKTFAHLKIGLAIFDKDRRLALFNPALVDLTGLAPENLSTRPTLHAFLDALRDAQRIPEPKDYKSWRMQIAQLEADAADGSYEETWHLPNGQTYRVSGRPHPDGAVAYLFEDISSEVSMTRSFRSEIEMCRAVLDNIDIAVAAFSESGYLTMANRAYAKLWQVEHQKAATDTGIIEASCQWRNMCLPSPAWESIRHVVLQSENRLPWTGGVTMRDGTELLCDVKPITGGATLVTFRNASANGGALLTLSPGEAGRLASA